MASKRKRQDDALFKKTKRQAYERDNGLCVLCGRRADDVHHIIFRSQLGTSEVNNLVCLCSECHMKSHGIKSKKVRQKLLKLAERIN